MMNAGAWLLATAMAVAVVTLLFLVVATARSIHNEREKGRSIWREFSLGLVLMTLFFITWIAHAFAEWQVFTDEQRQHGQIPEIGDFAAEFTQSTLENWQSEFLQLFTFVVLASLYIHKGSAESKDGEENIEASLRRIETKLGTLPKSAPTSFGEAWKLPDTALEAHDPPQRKPRKRATR